MHHPLQNLEDDFADCNTRCLRRIVVDWGKLDNIGANNF